MHLCIQLPDNNSHIYRHYTVCLTVIFKLKLYKQFNKKLKLHTCNHSVTVILVEITEALYVKMIKCNAQVYYGVINADSETMAVYMPDDCTVQSSLQFAAFIYLKVKVIQQVMVDQVLPLFSNCGISFF